MTARRAAAERFTRVENHEDFTSHHLAATDGACTTSSVDAVATASTKSIIAVQTVEENSVDGLLSDDGRRSDVHTPAQARKNTPQSRSGSSGDVNAADSHPEARDRAANNAHENTSKREALSSTAVSNASGEPCKPVQSPSKDDEYVLSESGEDMDCDESEMDCDESETDQSEMQAPKSTGDCSTDDNKQKAEAQFESDPTPPTAALGADVHTQHRGPATSSACVNIATCESQVASGVNGRPREKREICAGLEVNFDAKKNLNERIHRGNEVRQTGRSAPQLLGKISTNSSDITADGTQEHAHLDDSALATRLTVNKIGCEREPSIHGEYVLSDSDDEDIDCNNSDTRQSVEQTSQSISNPGASHDQMGNALLESGAGVPPVESRDMPSTVSVAAGETETTNDVSKCVPTTNELAPRKTLAAGKQLPVSCGDELTLLLATAPAPVAAETETAVVSVTPPPVKQKLSLVSTGSQTNSLRELLVPRRTKDEAKDCFDDDEEFDFEKWFAKHAGEDGTVSQHQIELKLLEQKHQSDRLMQNITIHCLERQRRTYADLMRDTKTVCGDRTMCANFLFYSRV